MILNKCDICGLEVKQHSLTTLYEDIQPKGIEHACTVCYKEIVTAKRKIEDALRPIQASWLKKIILKMKTVALRKQGGPS